MTDSTNAAAEPTFTSTQPTTEFTAADLTQTAVLPDPAEPQPQPQPQAYGQAPAHPQQHASAQPSARPTNVLAVITLALAVLGFAVVPVVTGHLALNQIKRTGDDGRPVALAGLVLGYIWLAGYALFALFFVGALFLSAMHAIGGAFYYYR